MLRTNLLDDYFYNQPDLTFIENLKRAEEPKVDVRMPCDGEITAVGIFIGENAFERIENLQTVFNGFTRFIKNNNLSGDVLPVDILYNGNVDKKSYVINVTKKSITVTASEEEIVRRAIIKLMDLIAMGGGCLKIGETKITETLDMRISRCFFSPINRPPKNVEELDCDTDFYPDGYLYTLMRHGVNAIWITSQLSSLIKSSYITEFGAGCEKRIERLNKTIKKCARYGIKVFLLLIEPISLCEDSVKTKFPDLYKKYPQAKGNDSAGPAAFCTFTEFGENYLKEAIKNLFTSAENLGGIISITWGERVTSCANSWPNGKGEWSNNCPHCKDKSRAEIVSHTVKIIVDAMKSVSPQAEFISWTYGHRGTPLKEVDEYVKKVPNNSVSMQNFEDDGRVMQLGKKRFALDYFLCYAGPSDMFSFTADKAREYGKKLYAKMQVCCSHELASMPYIPVPGIIYDKITRAKKLGVTGVMESWFFGNYPCIMTKAVDLLSDNTVYKDKKDFLLALSALYFKNENVAVAAKAFDLFEKAYTLYPVNVMFNYYGPMHDGIVWEYALKPKNFSLPRTWKLEDRPDGDRIGECLFTGHTIDEAITLCTELSKEWERGCALLSETGERNEITDVADALAILFKSGLNALEFYKLRDELGYMKTDNPSEVLSRMRNIVSVEMDNTEKMIACCEKNNCFGYHSEAEGFKFFPEKLKDRKEKLKKLLATEFVETENRIKGGLYPLEYYLGKEADVAKYKASITSLDDAERCYLDDGKTWFKVCVTDKKVDMEFYSDKRIDFFVCNEFRLMFPQPTYIFDRDGKVCLFRDAKTHQSVLDEKTEEWLSFWEVSNLSENGNTHLIVSGDKIRIGFMRLPYKLLVRTDVGANWCKDKQPVRVLGKCTTSPADFGWIV